MEDGAESSEQTHYGTPDGSRDSKERKWEEEKGVTPEGTSM